MRAAWVVVAICCLCAGAAADTKKDKKKEAAELIARVQAATDIRAPGSAPFRLRARVRIEGMTGGPYDGTYSLVWASPQQWREEISFWGFQEVRVFVGEKLWVKRDVDFIPYRVTQLRWLLNFPSRLSLRTKEKVRKTSAPDKKRPNLECVGLGQTAIVREMCFEHNPDRLVKHTVRGITNSYFFELADYVALADKIFPRRITYVDQGERVLDVTVEDLTNALADSTSVFAPPEGAVMWPWCEKPSRVREPNRFFEDLLPTNLRTASFCLQFAVYAVVDTDGKATNLRVVQNNLPNLERHILNAIERTRFTPSACGGVPIKSETTFEFGVYQRVEFTGPRVIFSP